MYKCLDSLSVIIFNNIYSYIEGKIDEKEI